MSEGVKGREDMEKEGCGWNRREWTVLVDLIKGRACGIKGGRSEGSGGRRVRVNGEL